MSIFISYSSKDIIYAKKMVEAIRANQEEVWFAVDSIKTGENYAESIVRAIANSDTVLMLLSKNSVESRHVKIELNLALDNNVKIYPVRLEDILPDADMKYYFITSQWYDLFYEEFEESLSTFINSTFPKKNVPVIEEQQEIIEVSKAEIEGTPSTLDIELEVPEEYGVKSFFETNEEYIKRNLEYGYVATSTFELINSNYSIDLKEFTLIVDDTVEFNTITIEPAKAKKLSRESKNRNIYQKFSLVNDSLKKSYFVISDDKVYGLEVSEQVVKKKKELEALELNKVKLERESEFKILFAWADKFNISADIFPRNLEELTDLIALILSENNITEIPKELGSLTNLRHLSLDHNQITEIPKELGSLTNLTYLSLDHNQITEIPEELGSLTNLSHLSLAHNQITEIPKELGSLTNLELLCLNHNQITEIPKELKSLTNLTVLYLIFNQITEIPKELGSLTNLTGLWLNHNQITEIEPSLKHMKNIIKV